MDKLVVRLFPYKGAVDMKRAQDAIRMAAANTTAGARMPLELYI
jgi:hypothetical protein